VVLHLAAATGKTRPEKYLAVNTEGTRLLIEQCKRFGVRNFLYVSTIAVKFQDKSQYYYAQSKEKAEDLVKNSGLNYVILRPTIVLGKEAAIWKSLSQLARAPIIPLFGDGTAKIQPIYVDDLVNVIRSVVDEKMFFNETFELGGPEVNTMEVFLKQIHKIVYKKEPRIIHLPLRQLIPALSLLDKYLYFLMPFTVGQLAAFENDSSIEPNRLYHQHRPEMKNVGAMLKLLIVDN
jgi:NADH dehydrogenase